MVSRDTLFRVPDHSKTFLFLFKKSKAFLRRKGWKRTSKGDFEISFHSHTFGIDAKAIKLLIKTFRLLGWKARLKQYKGAPTKGHDYTWSFSNLK